VIVAALLDYSVHGTLRNPPLVLLHAGGLSRREWESFLPAWSEHFFVIAPSALAHGRSPNVPEISVPAMAAAVLALLDALGLPHAHLLGSSMGGATALHITLTHPEKVERLILYRFAHKGGPEHRHALARLARPEIWRQWGMEQWMAAEHAPQGGREAWKEVLKKVVRALEEDPTRPDTSPGSFPTSTLDHLRRIEQSVLLIAGDRDDLAPVPNVVEMYQTLPKASLWIVPGAGHVMGMETWRRPAFEAEVLRFLRRP
jgi:3-oxoadipate enol-lactonase